MILKIIAFNSPEYQKMVHLRTDILRTPLGLTLTKEDLALDKNDILIGYFNDSCAELLACCVLTKIDEDIIKLRQMAVVENWQGKGIGRELILFAEKFAKKQGFNQMVMNARKVAIGFYQKLGYKIVSDEFIEVTIPHVKMDKTI